MILRASRFILFLKNYKNESSRELYKADIVISELFKGNELKSIYVAGRSDGGIGSSCAIFIPENTELIVYARKNKDGKYSVGMCSGLLYLNKRNIKRRKRELDILKMFKSKNIDFTDKINYREKAKLHKDLEQFKGIELEKSYGIYEIIFDSELNIKTVNEISGFDNTLLTASEKIDESTGTISTSVGAISEASSQLNSLLFPIIASIGIIVALQITIIARRR